MKSQRAYAGHVIECIRRIAEDSVSGRDAVFASRTLQDAIVRNLQVLCESTQRIGETHKQRHPEINWPSIAGMRNVLVHDYFEVDFETVWLVVIRDLPALEKAMRAILATLDQSRWGTLFHRGEHRQDVDLTGKSRPSGVGISRRVRNVSSVGAEFPNPRWHSNSAATAWHVFEVRQTYSCLKSAA